MRETLTAAVSLGFLFVTSAFCAGAADLTKAPISAKAPLAPPAYSWTGVYVGGDLGEAWTSNIGTWTPLPSPTAFGENIDSGGNRDSSFLGGLHAGYNLQFSPAWVAGIEGGWSWANANGSFTEQWMPTSGAPPLPGSSVTLSSKLNWLASLRGRFGYLLTPNLLAYASGGPAWARFDYTGSSSFPSITYFAGKTSSSVETGFTVGGGLEWALTSNWFVRAEYLYYRFNNSPTLIGQSATFPSYPSQFSWSSTSINVGQTGLSYKF
jgi:outer membrane immunogenic protein